MIRTLSLAVVAVLVSAACDSPTAPKGLLILPSAMTLEATASGSASGLDVACSLEFVASFETAGDEVRGSMSGEARRAATLPDGSGVAFQALAFYPDLRVSLITSRHARVRAFQNGEPWQPTGESRFWDEILAFEGVYDPASRTISGNWICRPLDTRNDVVGEIGGTWTLRPAMP